MEILLISSGVLLLGPAILSIMVLGNQFINVLKYLIFFAVIFLVVFHLLPDSIELCGWNAMVTFGVGLIIPVWLEKIKTIRSTQVHGVVTIISLVGIGFHSLIDGMAISIIDVDFMSTFTGLPMGIILHRFMVGLTVWGIMKPFYRRRIIFSTLIILIIISIGGFYIGEIIVPETLDSGRGYFQAFVSGMLLHIVFHQSWKVRNK